MREGADNFLCFWQSNYLFPPLIHCFFTSIYINLLSFSPTFFSTRIIKARYHNFTTSPVQYYLN